MNFIWCSKSRTHSESLSILSQYRKIKEYWKCQNHLKIMALEIWRLTVQTYPSEEITFFLHRLYRIQMWMWCNAKINFQMHSLHFLPIFAFFPKKDHQWNRKIYLKDEFQGYITRIWMKYEHKNKKVTHGFVNDISWRIDGYLNQNGKNKIPNFLKTSFLVLYYDVLKLFDQEWIFL